METEETELKPKPKRVITPEERQSAYIAMRDAGYTQSQAAHAVGYAPNSTSYLSKKVEPKREIFNDVHAKKAKKSVLSMIEGQAVGESGPPKPSDVLRATEIVLDRTHPTIQRIESSNVSVHLQLTDEERAAYLAALQSELAPQPIDITPSERQ